MTVDTPQDVRMGIRADLVMEWSPKPQPHEMSSGHIESLYSFDLGDRVQRRLRLDWKYEIKVEDSVLDSYRPDFSSSMSYLLEMRFKIHIAIQKVFDSAFPMHSKVSRMFMVIKQH